MVNDDEMLDFPARQAKGAKYVTSVCTGSHGAGGCRSAARLPRDDALAAMDHLAAIRRDADQDAGVRRPQPRHRRPAVTAASILR